MQFHFAAMTPSYADAIVKWKYDGMYAFYDYENEGDHIQDTSEWGNTLFAVLDEENRLVGELSIGFLDSTDEWVSQDAMDAGQLDGCILWIGFGMRPDLTGCGHGLSFVNACAAFAARLARERYHYIGEDIGLGVYQFNQRAIKVYERAGFVKFYEGCESIEGKSFPTQRMKKPIDLE